MASLNQVTSLIAAADSPSVARPALSAAAPQQIQRNQQALARQDTDNLRNLNTRLAALDAQVELLTLDDIVLANSTTTNTPSSQSPTVAVRAAWQAIGGEFKALVDRLATQTTLTSRAPIGLSVDMGAPLAEAGFDERPTSSVFLINGQRVVVNAAADSLDDVLARINNSPAGVVATFDHLTARLQLRARLGGNQPIALAERVGNFLRATRLIGAAIEPGQEARIRILTESGEQVLTALDNLLADALPGVTLELLRESGEPTTVTIARDRMQVLRAARGFVAAVNQFSDLVAELSGNGEALGPTIAGKLGREIQDQIQRLIAGQLGRPGPGGLALAALGFGTAVTPRGSWLTLDESKLAAALQATPRNVAALLTGPEGLFVQIRQVLAGLTGPDGRLADLIGRAEREVAEPASRIRSASDRVLAREQTVRARFGTLAETLAALRDQRQQLATQLEQLGAEPEESR